MKRGFIKKHWLALAFNFLSVIFLIKIFEDVLTNDLITKWDVIINLKLSLFWKIIFLNKIMIFITNIANTFVLIVLSLIFLLYLGYKKRWHSSLLLISSLIAGLISELTIKSLTHRLRPEIHLMEISEYSFPSGHATMAVIFFFLLIYLLKDNIKNKSLRLFFITGSIILTILIAFSRVYLGAHWFSDVAAGIFLGIFWITFFIMILGVKKNK